MKHYLRKKLKTLRANLEPEYRNHAEKLISAKFANFLQDKKLHKIATYYSISSEFNMCEVNDQLFATHLEVSLPYISLNKEVCFKRWYPSEKLFWHENFYQPADNAINTSPELIIVPLLGFDKNGHRIGYGRGFYDRLLNLYPLSNRVALAYSKQEIKDIPIEEHDQKVDFIITEQELITCKQPKI